MRSSAASASCRSSSPSRTAARSSWSAPAPGVGDTNAEAIHYLAIASARRSLDICAAYFAPRPAFADALREAAERGVEVRIVVPGPYIDKETVRRAGRAAYEPLLKGGVRIFEYQPTMLHAKTLAVDGCWAAVGTMNFDNRSFQLNDEITLGVRERALLRRAARELRGRPRTQRGDRPRAVGAARAARQGQGAGDGDDSARAVSAAMAIRAQVEQDLVGESGISEVSSAAVDHRGRSSLRSRSSRRSLSAESLSV